MSQPGGQVFRLHLAVAVVPRYTIIKVKYYFHVITLSYAVPLTCIGLVRGVKL